MYVAKPDHIQSFVLFHKLDFGTAVKSPERKILQILILYV